ncbi:glutaredoxin family protein [Bacillus sp. sid0103]|uniref:glutaredoxin family protein n=1 Tax=Bacillus sp. sid0103 TaxID=2856337 RepID=UPI001C46E361|nr:glutaredoxin family protein [Bacillus sp. sid0103]MBV7504472.1 glutaredoxin family protein [Bacillus sp. sid0103]
MSNPLSVVVWSKQGCHFCSEVKQFLEEKQVEFQTIDVTNHDEYRNILDVKYGIRHVPVIEIGQDGLYQGVTEVGISYLEKALAPFLQNR